MALQRDVKNSTNSENDVAKETKTQISEGQISEGKISGLVIQNRQGT